MKNNLTNFKNNWPLDIIVIQPGNIGDLLFLQKLFVVMSRIGYNVHIPLKSNIYNQFKDTILLDNSRIKYYDMESDFPFRKEFVGSVNFVNMNLPYSVYPTFITNNILVLPLSYTWY
jgi:hypothetical protein